MKIYEVTDYLGDHIIQKYYLSDSDADMHFLNVRYQDTKMQDHPEVRMVVREFEQVGEDIVTVPENPLPLDEILFGG